MKKYLVTIPITGGIHISVEAESKQEAKHKAFDRIDNEGQECGEVEWDYTERVAYGNVCVAMYNEIDVNEEG